MTLAAKRTQGVHGPQCASVKGLSPVMRRTVGADVLSNTEGHIRGTNGHGPREPTGVEDRSTCTRQSRELGRSSGLLQEGGRMVQPAHWQASQRPRGSRMPSYERRSGVTPAEQRGAQPAARSMATSATRRGGATTITGVEQIAQRARSQPTAPFTALMHHFSVDNLRACFVALDGTKAPGVDGVTKEM